MSNILTQHKQQQQPNINQSLSDDCFRLIFAEFSLREQIHLRSVCIRWQVIIEQICRGKQTLKLFGSKEAVRQYLESVTNFKVPDMLPHSQPVTDVSSDTLVIKPNLDLECACNALSGLFQNVRILVIYCPQLFKCHQMPDMLSSWTAKLSALIIFKPRVDPLTLENFWNAISHMRSLERLHLIQMYSLQIPRQTIAPILGSLKHFAIAHYLDDIYSVLVQLGPRIESLKLSCVSLNVEQLQLLIEQNPNLIESLEMLTLGLISPHGNGLSRVENLREVLQFICKKFVNLNFLDIVMTDQVSFRVWLRFFFYK